MSRQTKKKQLVQCPRCCGTGEEPGSPQRADEKALCYDCGGMKVLPRTTAIRLMAKSQYELDGQIEVDDNAVISEASEANGCYVQAWVWVDLSSNPDLSKEY